MLDALLEKPRCRILDILTKKRMVTSFVAPCAWIVGDDANGLLPPQIGVCVALPVSIEHGYY